MTVALVRDSSGTAFAGGVRHSAALDIVLLAALALVLHEAAHSQLWTLDSTRDDYHLSR